MNLIHKILILLFGVAICVQAVPPVLNYAGQVAVNGEAFDGNGLFKFALVNADGATTYWSNDGKSVDGLEPQASVAVPVNGGLYSILLGNTAQQGMGAIDPAVFAQHTDAKLRVWFSDGVNGFQQLSPDRPFASVPYAFSAGIAGSVNITNGAITKSMLGEEILSDLNRTITKQMLGQDVLSDLNRIVTPEMIQASSITTSQLNEQILKYLRPEITSQPQAQTVYADSNVSYSVTAEGKYLTYQWKKDGVNLAGEANATLNITDANATLHNGNYSVVVSNDFGSVESEEVEVSVFSFQPLALQGLRLWLDASELNSSESLWIDKSDNGNNALRNGNPVIVPELQNGKSVMRYSGTNGEHHSFNRITDIRTAFWVIRKDLLHGLCFLLGDEASASFHAGDDNKLFWGSSVGNFNLLRINGLISGISSSTFSSSFTIISLRSVKNLSASNFSKDRAWGNRVWKGDLGELIIYNSELSVSEFEKVEGYLAHKWGLTANLPGDHPYKNTAP